MGLQLTDQQRQVLLDEALAVHRLVVEERLAARAAERSALQRALEAGEKMQMIFESLEGERGAWTKWRNQNVPRPKQRSLDDYRRIYRNRERCRSAATIRQALVMCQTRDRRIEAKRIRRSPPTLPAGRYRIIMSDPPWDVAGVRYPTMEAWEIAMLPVEQFAAEDAVLCMWVVEQYLPDAFGIMGKWGFDYRGLLAWDKERAGPGYFLRGQVELALFGIRGNPSIMRGGITNLLHEVRRQHSRKPEGIFRLLEQLVPCADGERLEMFSRGQRPGWQQHGAVPNKFPAAAE